MRTLRCLFDDVPLRNQELPGPTHIEDLYLVIGTPNPTWKKLRKEEKRFVLMMRSRDEAM